jgi:hypothetical protein
MTGAWSQALDYVTSLNHIACCGVVIYTLKIYTTDLSNTTISPGLIDALKDIVKGHAAWLHKGCPMLYDENENILHNLKFICMYSCSKL